MSPRIGRLHICVIRLTIVFLLSYTVFGNASARRKEVLSSQVLRFQHVFRQSSAYTCGPAALASLIAFYFGDDATEAEITLLAEQSDGQRGETSGERRGLSMLALKKAAEIKGYAAVGYRMTWDHVVAFLQRGAAPLLIHLPGPQPHYALLVALYDDFVFVADPSLGETIMHKDELLRKWEGIALYVTGDEAAMNRSQQRMATKTLQMSRRIHMLRRGGQT